MGSIFAFGLGAPYFFRLRGYMITLLEAVNSILRNLGTTKVTNTEVSNPDVQAALDAIQETRRSVQARGWWFNKQTNVTLPVNLVGNIPVPSTTIKVDTSRTGLDVVQRGMKLFNRETNSDQFTEALTDIDIVILLPWEDLPFTAQEYIRLLAMHQVQSDLEGDELKLNKIEQKISTANFEFRREHVQNRDLNAFRSTRASIMLNRRRGGSRPSGNILGGTL